MHPLVQRLDTGKGLPRRAIADCFANIDNVADALLALVAKAADATLDDAEQDPFFLGLHILAAARERRLFAPLLRLLRLPPEKLEALLGDADTTTLPRVVIGCFDGNAAELFALIRDATRDEYMRSSLLAALPFLTWEGRIDAALTRDFLERFDDDRAVPDEDFGWIQWSVAIELLGWSDLAPRVERAYADRRIPPEYSDVEHFRRALAKSQAAPDSPDRFEEERLGYVDLDTVFQDFDFTPRKDSRPDRAGGNDTIRAAYPAAAPGPLDRSGGFPPAVGPKPKVGRNDPCPCGSGKKYKRCCGAVLA